MRLRYLLIILIFTFSFPRLSAQITGDSVPCYGSQQVYSFTGSSDGYLFWSVSIGNITYSITNSQFLVQWQQSGTFIISCTYTDAYSFTDTAYDTIHVQPLPSPLITALNSQGGCVSIPGVNYSSDDLGSSLLSGPATDISLASSCYSVCDSGWYFYKARGWAGSSFSWRTPGANALALSLTTDTVKVDWMAALPPQYTLLQNTSLILIETSAAGCRDSSSICIAVNAKPHACFTSSPSDSAGVVRLCSGSTVSFSDSCSWVLQWLGSPGAIVNRTWIFGDGTIVENESTVTHQYYHSGTYLVQYIAQSNCYCADTFHMLVRVDSLAGPQIECVRTVCHNTWATYYVPDTCSHLFTWTVTGADSIFVSNDSLYVLWGSCNGGFGTVSVITDCPSFCPYQTTVRVPVIPDSAAITGPTIVCRYDNVTYSVPSVPGMGYIWYKPDSIPGPYSAYSPYYTFNSELYNTLGTGYTRFPDTLYIAVRYYNQFIGNCQGFSVLPVLVTTGIAVNFAKGDSVICSSDSLLLNAVNSSTGQAIACNWSVYLLRNDSLVDTTSNSPHYFTDNLDPGSYIISTYSDTGKFCNVPVTTLVTVLTPPPPVAAPVIGPDSVCPNLLFTYYTEPTNLSQYYLQWNSINGTPAVGSGGSFSVSWLTPLPDTLVVLQRMLQSPGCPSSAVKIPIYPFSALTPAIAGDTLVCSDATALYSTGFSADNYAWSISPASSGSVKQGQGNDTIAIQWNHFTTDTIAYLLLIGTKCGNPDSCTIKIHIKPTPVPTISVSPASPICTGHSITFTSSLTGQYYIWNFGDGYIDTTVALDTIHKFSTDSSFAVSLTIGTPSGCPGTSVATTNVNVLPSPIGFLSTPQLTSYCTSGWADTFYVTLQNMGGAGFTYQFYYNLGAVGGAGSTSSYIANQFGSYYALITTSLGCSNPTDTPSVDSICAVSGGCSTDSTISFTSFVSCDSVVFSTTATSPITILNWYFDDNSPNAGSVSSVSHVYSKAGYYHPSISATAPGTGDGTCPISYQTTDTIPLVPNFLVQFQCQGSSGMHIQLIDISTYINPITTWSWHVNSTVYNTQDVDTPITAGTYTIELTIFDGVHTCSVSKTVTVPSSAAASFSCVDSQCITMPVKFTATDTTNIIGYLWDFGDTSYSALQNPSKVYATCPAVGGHGGGDAGCSQLVTLTVTDKFGCQSSYSKSVYYFQNSFAGQSITLIPGTSDVCANITEVITVMPSSGSLAGDSFKWNYNNHKSDFDTIHISESGNYTVTVSDAYGCTVAPAQAATLIFNTIQGFISGDTLYCNHTYTNLNVFQGLQYQYYWLYTKDSTGPATHNTLPASSQSFTFAHVMAVDTFNYGRVWGVIRDSIGPSLYCEDTVGPVVVHTYPAIPNPNTSDPQCVLYQPAVFIATPPAGDFVLWNTGLVSDTLITSIPGSYSAKFIDTNGCVSDQSAVFTADPGPSFDGLATGCYTFCTGDSPYLYVPLNVEGDFVEWIRNDTALTEPSEFYALQPGTYQLVLNDNNSDAGCQDTSLPISISFVSCDSACFHHANIYCSNCYYDSSGGKRYIHLIISISDTIRSTMPITVTSTNLTILNYYPNTFLPGTATTYLNIDALADTSAGTEYCAQVNANGCQQTFCVNTSSLGCTNITPGRHGEESPRRRQKNKYKVINNK